MDSEKIPSENTIQTFLSNYPNLASVNLNPKDILNCKTSNQGEFDLKHIITAYEQDSYWKNF